MKKRFLAFLAALCMLSVLSGCDGVSDYGDVAYVDAVPSSVGQDGHGQQSGPGASVPSVPDWSAVLADGTSIPAWNGTEPVHVVNGNEPYFDAEDRGRTDPFEDYSELDGLGRCGVAYANVCLELMPTEARGEIGSVRPSGWHTVRYNDLISGNYLYNRCHLIGYQLAGENANARNLITGTRYLNIDGMLSYENMIDDYVEDTGNHVLYRVTPVYDGDDLVAAGVLMEGWSVEDGGAGICFNVFAYNVQPGIVIDYATGDSWRADGRDPEDDTGDKVLYVLNTKSGKFHLPDCSYAKSMSEGNRLEMEQTLSAMLQAGYSPCGSCHPDEQ